LNCDHLPHQEPEPFNEDEVLDNLEEDSEEPFDSTEQRIDPNLRVYINVDDEIAPGHLFDQHRRRRRYDERIRRRLRSHPRSRARHRRIQS
jgi:hypothetical protein